MLDMHPPILEVRRVAGRVLSTAALGLCAAASALAAGRLPPAAPDPNCPARATALVEHFIGADCAACWGANPAEAAVPGAQAVPDEAWSLDWIAPAASGTDDPALPSSLPEATERLARLGPYLPARLEAQPAGFDTGAELARPGAGRKLKIRSSLPYKGYFGVQMHATGTWPAGSTAWLGLVEEIKGDTGGTVVGRHVVRNVVGPLALPAGPGAKNTVAPLFALRWPETARPDRLMAAAWIEGRDGRILQITTDRCKDTSK
jgi:hypothetical protein